MFDLQSGSLPTSFKLFIPRSDNNVTCTITTRQHDNIQRLSPRTTFSSKLPKHNFIKIWNNIDELIRNQKSRNLFKRTLTKQFTAQYKTNVNVQTGDVETVIIMHKLKLHNFKLHNYTYLFYLSFFILFAFIICLHNLKWFIY